MKRNRLEFLERGRIFSAAMFALVLCGIFFSCDDEDDNGGGDSLKGNVVYFASNDPGGNSIFAYHHDAAGNLAQLAGSPFATGGDGFANPMQILGPNDSDNEVFITDDKKFLLATNSGSNSISVFTINGDGTLTPVAGSPFNSGGEMPVSVFVRGNRAFVVNKSQNPEMAPTQNPNYTAFNMASDGKLTMITDAEFETTPGSSPAQALVSNDGKFLFGADFLGFMIQPPVGTLRSFAIAGDGKLSPVQGSPWTIEGMGGALGLWQHPSENVLYVGFPLEAKLGIYSIDPSNGALSFESKVDAGPAACWVRTNARGDRTYVLNSGDNTISAYNSTSPKALTGLGKLSLKNPGPIYMAMGLPFVTSEAFSFELDPDENYMYVVSQHTNPDFSIGNYNYFHVVNISDEGMLSEPGEPLQIPVANTVRPRGVVVIKFD